MICPLPSPSPTMTPLPMTHPLIHSALVHCPPCYSSNRPDVLPSEGLCSGCFLCLECSSPQIPTQITLSLPWNLYSNVLFSGRPILTTLFKIITYILSLLHPLPLSFLPFSTFPLFPQPLSFSNILFSYQVCCLQSPHWTVNSTRAGINGLFTNVP